MDKNSSPNAPSPDDEIANLIGGVAPAAPAAPVRKAFGGGNTRNTNRFKPGQVPAGGPPVPPVRKLGSSFTPPTPQIQRHRERIAKARERLSVMVTMIDKESAAVSAIVNELKGIADGQAEAKKLDFDITEVETFLASLASAVDEITD